MLRKRIVRKGQNRMPRRQIKGVMANGRAKRVEMQAVDGYSLADLGRYVEQARRAGLPEDTPVVAESARFTGRLRKLVARTEGEGSK